MRKTWSNNYNFFHKFALTTTKHTKTSFNLFNPLYSSCHYYYSTKTSSTSPSETKKGVLKDNLSKFFSDHLNKWEGKDLLTAPHEDDVKWTWKDISKAMHATSQAFLITSRCKKGERIPYILDNGTTNFVGFLAAAQSETTFVPVPPSVTSKQIDFVLKKNRPRLVVFQPKYKEQNIVEIFDNLIKEVSEWPEDIPLNFKKYPYIKVLAITGIVSYTGGYNLFKDLLCYNIQPDPVPLPEKVSPDSILSCNINFESGNISTFTQNSLLNNGYFLGEKISLSTEDRMCLLTPLYNHFGIISGTIASVAKGAIVNLPARSFNEDVVMKAIERDHSTILNCSDEELTAILQHPNLDKFNHKLNKILLVRDLNNRGNSATADLSAAFQKLKVNEIFVAYGNNEGGIFLVDKISSDSSNKNNNSWEGNLLDNLEAKVNANSELLIKGYSVMKEYLNNPKETDAVKTADGWLNTRLKADIHTGGKVVLK